MFDDLLQDYPKLQIHYNENEIFLIGFIDIIDKDGQLWDSYEIEIHPSKVIDRFPSLFEVGGKIPKNPDWHIYVDTGSCCVTVTPDEIFNCNKGITFLTYMEKYVIPYFFNQTFRRLTGNYANGEYSHGKQGYLEYYQELFKIQDVSQITKILNWIKKNPKPKRTQKCFCGSNKLFRKCHRDCYEKIMLIGLKNVLQTLQQIL